MRISGPYTHGKAYRCRIETEGGRVCCPCAETPEDAIAAAQIVLSELKQRGALSLAEAIDLYGEAQRVDRGNRPGTITNSRTVLRRFFGPVLGESLRQLTTLRARRLYDELCSARSERTGKTLATDSHRNYLAQAKTFLTWCVDQGFARANVLTDVKGRGRRRHGKAQLRLDEARKLAQFCLKLAQQGDDGALAVLLALFMWLRAGEIVSRTARDVDNNGGLLHIAETGDWAPKTRAGRRTLEVPVELQPLLLARKRGRLPGAWLFPGEDGRPHWRDWVSAQVERCCKAAGVPVVCAHALRGTGATAAVQAGIAPAIVSAVLGHESPSTTLESYAAPGSADHAGRAAAASNLRLVRSQTSPKALERS